MTTSRTALLSFVLLGLSPISARAVDVPLPPPPPGVALQPAAPAPLSGYSIGLSAGLLAQGDVASACLQLDVGRKADLPRLKRIQIEWHLPIRAARPQWDGTLSRTITTPLPGLPPIITSETVGTTKDTNWIFEAIPSARAILPVAPGFALHVDAGVGLAVTAETHVEDEIYVGHTTTRKLVIAPSVNVALGLTYQLGDRLDVVFQPLVFGRRAKADAATYSALWGLSYRL